MGQLNIELFRKVRDRIAATPESYRQDTYCSPSLVAPCGTVCCIAGEAIICNAATVEQGITALKHMDGDVATVAARLLGLIDQQQDYYELHFDHPARRLFNGCPHEAWPEPFRSQWLVAPRDEEPYVAVAFLTHIIETGKVLE